ncbi:MAG: prepilin-type N-terminal cleavage/methylation domain-containing protein [Phycisphaerales bacterium]|jgi:prepilin-type N-terminal cleavage/methylation domain-containing protein|nr:prepilin-type N-terminal cleavage/methylation domain-containing protein [Phycisphaerales bacterium]
MKPLTFNRSGFTIVELMAVVAILAILAAIVLVGARSLDAAAMSSADLAHQRQIALADAQYAAANDSRLLHPRTEPDDAQFDFMDSDPNYDLAGKTPGQLAEDARERMWVRAYNDPSAQRLESLDGASISAERPAALSDGAAWEYLDGNLDVYRSPLDPTNRLRSYSLNAFVGVNVCADDAYFAQGSPLDPFGGDFIIYAVGCPTMMGVKQPSRTMCSIAEDDPGESGHPPGRNFNGFLLHPNQQVGAYENFQMWYDRPGLWDPTRINLSHMDGSTQSMPITTPDLVETLDSHRVIFDCTELRQLQQKLLPGVLEFRTEDDLPN